MTSPSPLSFLTWSDADFLLRQTLIGATPLMIAGLGELVSERAGVINIGIEGLMLTGCFCAYAVTALTGSYALGLLAAPLAAMLLALIFALVTVALRADQIVAGTAVNFVAAGLTATAWRAIEPRLSQTHIATLPIAPLQLLAAALVIFLCFVLRWTRAGVIVSALGENPDAVDAAGVPVRRWRIGAVLFGGLCAGVAGSYLSLFRTSGFSPDQIGGRGFLVLALVIFGRWRVTGLIAACLFFGLLDDAQRLFQGTGVSSFKGAEDLFRMIPYAATLAVLALLSRGHAGPAALARPWPPER